MKHALTEIITASGGLRLFKNLASYASGLYVGFKANVDPTSAFTFNIPTALPTSGTQALVCDVSGNMSFQALGGSGTVTSVSLSVPADLTVGGSPVTSSGTLAISRNSQSANVFLGSPNGSAGVPGYRSLAAADIPSLTAAKISDLTTTVQGYRHDQFAAPTASVNWNAQKLTGLADPTNPQDAVTKNYADALISTGSNKGSVRVALNNNVTLSNPGTNIFDGISLISGDLILLFGQTVSAQNGIYIFNGSSATLTRATNADTSAEVKAGLFVFVSEGTSNGNNGFTLTTDDPITLGTTALSFTQSSGAGQIIAGNGLTKTGNSIDVVGTTNRISVASDSIDIDAAYIGQTSITILGTIGTGTWNGNSIAVLNGGTGATTAATARTNLSAAGIYRTTFTSASLSSNVLTVTHGLNQQYIKVEIWDNNAQVIIPDSITATNSTSTAIDLTSYNSPSTISGTWNVIAIG